MTERRTDFETLNAYVDGELSSAAAAEVARAAARDLDVAARIASLREMKAAFGDLVPPVAYYPPTETRHWSIMRAVAFAAACAILMFGAVMFGTQTPEPRPEWSSVIESYHRSWAFSPNTSKAAPEELTVLDLSSAQLSFAGRERITIGTKILHRLGYEGTRGCRLSLFGVPSEIAISAHAFSAPLHAHVWRDGRSQYLLIADGMAASRFRELAAAIERSMRDGKPLDSETQQQLARARAASQPCRA